MSSFVVASVRRLFNDDATTSVVGLVPVEVASSVGAGVVGAGVTVVIVVVVGGVVREVLLAAALEGRVLVAGGSGASGSVGVAALPLLE